MKNDDWVHSWLESSLFNSYIKQFQKYISDQACILCQNTKIIPIFKEKLPNHEWVTTTDKQVDAIVICTNYQKGEDLVTDLQNMAKHMNDEGTIFLILFSKKSDWEDCLESLYPLKKYYVICEEFQNGQTGYFMYLKKRTIE